MDLISPPDLYQELKIVIFSQLSWLDISKLSVVCKHLVDDDLLIKIHSTSIGHEGHVVEGGLTLLQLQTFDRILACNYGKERIKSFYEITYIARYDGTVWYINRKEGNVWIQMEELKDIVQVAIETPYRRLVCLDKYGSIFIMGTVNRSQAN